MKYRVFFFFILLVFSCSDKSDILSKINFVKIKVQYSENTLINNKILLNKNDNRYKILNDFNIKEKISDNSSDIKKTDSSDEIVIDLTIDKKDSSSDLKKENFIYKDQDILFYEKTASDFENIFKQSLTETFKNNKIIFYNNDSDVTPDTNSLKLDMYCYINRYNTGEFNLIRNLPTVMDISILIKNEKFKIQKKYNKKIRVNSISEYPTEKIRLRFISDSLSVFLNNELKKIKIKDNIDNTKAKKDVKKNKNNDNTSDIKNKEEKK